MRVLLASLPTSSIDLLFGNMNLQGKTMSRSAAAAAAAAAFGKWTQVRLEGRGREAGDRDDHRERHLKRSGVRQVRLPHNA